MTLRAASVDLLTRVAPGVADRVSKALPGIDRLSEQFRRLFGMPSPFWTTPNEWSRFTTAEATRLLDQLRREGLILLPGFLSAEELTRVRASLDEAFSHLDVSRIEFRPDHKYYACLQPLRLCPEIADAAIDGDLLKLAGACFRRTPFLSEADFRRVLPLDMTVHERENEKFARGYSSSHWHHDVHGRELKVMIYLTDVGPGDQNFVYLIGSHKGFRSARYEATRFSDQQVDNMNHTRLECYAPAGTAIVFDTNGIHRLRRFNTRSRDSVTFNYHPGRMCQSVPLEIHPESLARNRAEFFRTTTVAP
jgi:Phytanoyl-CoA dioxygenase (PhyH)